MGGSVPVISQTEKILFEILRGVHVIEESPANGECEPEAEAEQCGNGKNG